MRDQHLDLVLTALSSAPRMGWRTTGSGCANVSENQLPKIDPRDPVAGGSMTGAAVTLTVTCKVAAGAVPFVAVTMKSNLPATVGVPERVGTPVTGSFANVVPGGSFAGSTTVTAAAGVPVTAKVRVKTV